MRAVFSKCLAIAMLVTGLVTCVDFVVPDLVTIGLWMLILPGLALAIAPTLFLYLATFSVPWFVMSRQRILSAVLAGLVAIGVLGLVLPRLLNFVSEAWLAQAQSKEKLPLAKVPPAGVVGLETPPKSGSAACGDLCQTLLYDAGVERVVLFPGKPNGHTSFHLERQDNCTAYDTNRSSQAHWLKPDEAKRIAKATRLREAGGECLVKDEEWTGEPGWVLRRFSEDFGPPAGYLQLRPGEVHADGLELVVRGTVVARQQALRSRLLSTPLYVTFRSGSELKVLGWEWARFGLTENAPDPIAFLERFTDQSVQPTTTRAEPEQVRRTLEAALANPDAAGAAFTLVNDYYDLVRKQSRPEDARLMARLIGDRRVTNFWTLPLHKIRSQSDRLLLRDPILQRMRELADEENWDAYRALASAGGRLPELAFRGANPALDTLLGDPDRRRAGAALVRRLADRGPSAAPALVAFVQEGWKKPESRAKRRTVPGSVGDDGRAALAGLCELGLDARQSLPQLRQAAASEIVPPRMQESELWRATLIALGANPGEFTVPKDTKWPLERYRANLNELAHQKCKGKY